MRDTFWFAAAEPDLQIREGPGHPDPEISGGLVSKQFFTALGAAVWSNNKKGADNCGILKFEDLTCRILKFQYLACRNLKFTVSDPNLQIREGPGNQDPEIDSGLSLV